VSSLGALVSFFANSGVDFWNPGIEKKMGLCGIGGARRPRCRPHGGPRKFFGVRVDMHMEHLIDGDVYTRCLSFLPPVITNFVLGFQVLSEITKAMPTC
jgi:hypothetical protein